MRIISPRAVREFADLHANSRKPLAEWLRKAVAADWKSLADVRKDMPRTDAVPLPNGRTATIFDVGGNNYRVAVSMHYDRGRLYVRRIMTHAEYDKGDWVRDF